MDMYFCMVRKKIGYALVGWLAFGLAGLGLSAQTHTQTQPDAALLRKQLPHLLSDLALRPQVLAGLAAPTVGTYKSNKYVALLPQATVVIGADGSASYEAVVFAEGDADAAGANHSRWAQAIGTALNCPVTYGFSPEGTFEATCMQPSALVRVLLAQQASGACRVTVILSDTN
jgi:hypothetical protein